MRDLPSHGKSVAIYLDAPRLLCKLCDKTFTAADSGWAAFQNVSDQALGFEPAIFAKMEKSLLKRQKKSVESD